MSHFEFCSGHYCLHSGGWGCPLALRSIAWWAYGPASGTRGSPGALLIALSRMAVDQTHTDCDHGANEGPSTGSYVADPKRGARARRVADTGGFLEIPV